MLLTHFHSDHIDGLGELLMQRWVSTGNAVPVPLYGPPGVDKVVAQLPTATGGFWSEFAAFIAEFGYRGPSEWDLGTESWESKPSLALSLIDKMRQLDDSESPSAKQASHAAATDKAMLAATEGMDPATEAMFRGAIGSARRFAGWRESGKSSCIKVMNEARMALIELGSRLESAGVLDHSRQIFIALDAELDALALKETTLLPTLRQREKDWNDLKDLEVPTFLDGSKPIPPISEVPRKGASSAERATVGAVFNGAAAGRFVVVAFTGGLGLGCDAVDSLDARDRGLDPDRLVA